jgi:hypothetical protein
MFMNGMMLQKDNDNFEFTVNVIRWLRDKPDGSKRERALLVVDGKILPNFDVSLIPPPPPMPVPPAKVIDGLLRSWEDERFFHRVLFELIDVNRLAALMLVLGTFVLLVVGAKRVMEGRSVPQAAVPLMVGGSGAAAMAPLMRQRSDALLRQDNFWEPARALVLLWVSEQFSAAAEVILIGPALQERSLRRTAELVMRLAGADEPIPVTRAEFVGLAEGLPALSQAVRQKRLALQAGEKTLRQ